MRQRGNSLTSRTLSENLLLRQTLSTYNLVGSDGGVLVAAEGLDGSGDLLAQNAQLLLDQAPVRRAERAVRVPVDGDGGVELVDGGLEQLLGDGLDDPQLHLGLVDLQGRLDGPEGELLVAGLRGEGAEGEELHGALEGLGVQLVLREHGLLRGLEGQVLGQRAVHDDLQQLHQGLHRRREVLGVDGLKERDAVAEGIEGGVDGAEHGRGDELLHLGGVAAGLVLEGLEVSHQSLHGDGLVVLLLQNEREVAQQYPAGLHREAPRLDPAVGFLREMRDKAGLLRGQREFQYSVQHFTLRLASKYNVEQHGQHVQSNSGLIFLI
eukprot:Colp12_sorted_trinity150504_noHs@7054